MAKLKIETNYIPITPEANQSDFVLSNAGAESTDPTDFKAALNNAAGSPIEQLAKSSGSDVMFLGSLQSSNFVTGASGSGWRLDSNGNLEANEGDFRGTITATAGAIGGWTIIDGYIYSLASGTPSASPADGLVLVSGNESLIVYENTEKRVELGYLSSGVYGIKVYADDGSTVIFEVSDTQKIFDGQYLSGNSVASASVKPSLRGSSHNLVFSASDADTVAWASGTITLSDGTAYSIDAGNTGNMSARTYIYLDIGTSETVLQTSTTFSDAVGENKILIASAENGTGEATFYVLGGIGGLNIDASSIIVANLAAINADLGTITAGTITIDTAGYVRGGMTDYLTGTGFFLGYSGSAYKFSVGNPAANYISWDGSALTVNGYALESKIVYAVGDILVSSSDSEVGGVANEYTKRKEIAIAKDGTLRIKFTLKVGSGAYTAYGRIYVNGIAVGTEQTTTSTVGVEFSEDIGSLEKGDLVQVYSHSTDNQNNYISNFRLYADAYEFCTVII